MAAGIAALMRQAAMAFGFALVLLPLASSPAQQTQPSASGLYAQATAALLDRSFPSPRVEYLLLDARTGQTVAMRWSHPEHPVPVGSLLKPFIALAYAQLHTTAQPFPIVYCHGKSDGCWREGGHGALSLEPALAGSCNAYFLKLAQDLSASRPGMDALNRVSAEYGLPAPPSSSAPAMLIGVTPEWRISPMALAHAYVTLTTQTHSETAARLLTGMQLAAGPGGTANKAGQHPGGLLAKTGTAPCVADPESNAPRCLANGDGLAVLITPAQNPRLLLFVRQRSTTGAMTAQLAGQMLTQLEEAHAPSH